MSRDAGGGNDQAVPVGSEAAGEVEGLDQPMLPATVAVALDGAGAVDALVGGTDRFDRPVQGVLVGFDLGDQKVSGIPRGFKGF
ncbi:MAG: hypothetical protein U1E43_05640 [Rhodospirillales bacterium]